MKKILFLSLIFLSPNIKSNQQKILKYGAIGAAIGAGSYILYKLFFKPLPTQKIILNTQMQVESSNQVYSELFKILKSDSNQIKNEFTLIKVLDCLTSLGVTNFDNFKLQIISNIEKLEKNTKELEKRSYSDKELNSYDIEKINMLVKDSKSLLIELNELNRFLNNHKCYFKSAILQEQLFNKYNTAIKSLRIKKELKNKIKEIAYSKFGNSSYPLLSLEQELKRDINLLKNYSINYGTQLIETKNRLTTYLESIYVKLISLNEYQHQKEKYELMKKIDNLEHKIRKAQNDVNMGRFENFVYNLDICV